MWSSVADKRQYSCRGGPMCPPLDSGRTRRRAQRMPRFVIATRYEFPWCNGVKNSSILPLNFTERDGINTRNRHFPLGKNTYQLSRTHRPSPGAHPAAIVYGTGLWGRGTQDYLRHGSPTMPPVSISLRDKGSPDAGPATGAKIFYNSQKILSPYAARTGPAPYRRPVRYPYSVCQKYFSTAASF